MASALEQHAKAPSTDAMTQTDTQPIDSQPANPALPVADITVISDEDENVAAYEVINTARDGGTGALTLMFFKLAKKLHFLS